MTHSSQRVSDRTEDVPSTASPTCTFGDISWRGLTFHHMAQPLLSFSFVLHVEFLHWSLVVLQGATCFFRCDIHYRAECKCRHTQTSPLPCMLAQGQVCGVPFSEAAVFCSHNGCSYVGERDLHIPWSWSSRVPHIWE